MLAAFWQCLRPFEWGPGGVAGWVRRPVADELGRGLGGGRRSPKVGRGAVGSASACALPVALVPTLESGRTGLAKGQVVCWGFGCRCSCSAALFGGLMSQMSQWRPNEPDEPVGRLLPDEPLADELAVGPGRYPYRLVA